jgi:hypothetical protein
LARYRQVDAKWLNSADSGAIVVHVKNNDWVVLGMRETESKYWHVKSKVSELKKHSNILINK